MPKDAHDITTPSELVEALQFYLRAALERIDAEPAEIVNALAMPGFGRDEAEALLALDVNALDQSSLDAGLAPSR